MRSILRTRYLVLATVTTAALALAATRPELFGERVRNALDGLAEAEPLWLWAAAAAFVAMHVLSGLAWRSALDAGGTRTRRSDAVARYGVGSGLNAVAPAHLGSAIRVALFTRTVAGEGGAWRVGGAAVCVGAVRSVWLAALVAFAAVTEAVPVWPLALIGVALGVAAAAAILSRNIRLERRSAHILDAFRGLARAPRSLAVVAVLTALGMAAKLAAATAVAAALGVDHPLLAALVVVPAVELAAVMPITPGNAGVASAAVAFVLGAHGVAADTALAAGIAFGAVETLSALALGAGGALFLSAPSMRPAFRVAVASTAAVAVTGAYSATVLLPLL
jgi:uncharacterized membrane protein YbhN (UPF0104 family)